MNGGTCRPGIWGKMGLFCSDAHRWSQGLTRVPSCWHTWLRSLLLLGQIPPIPKGQLYPSSYKRPPLSASECSRGSQPACRPPEGSPSRTARTCVIPTSPSTRRSWAQCTQAPREYVLSTEQALSDPTVFFTCVLCIQVSCAETGTRALTPRLGLCLYNSQPCQAKN